MARRKGQVFERTIAAWLAGYGYENRNRSGHDGDDGLLRRHRISIEAKNRAKMDLAGWLAQADKQRDPALADVAVVVHKRRGTTDPDEHYVTMTGQAFRRLLDKIQ